MRPFPGIEDLRSSGNVPRLHPNGFIQLDLKDGRRLHVWPEEAIRVREPRTPIHDHVFDLKSEVYLGALINKMYKLIEDPHGEHEVHGILSFSVARETSGFTRLDERRYRLVLVEEARIEAPGIYVIPAFEFHESENVGLSATIVTMTASDASRPARVACHTGRAPTEIFNRDGGPEEREQLWSIIERACTALT